MGTTESTPEQTSDQLVQDVAQVESDHRKQVKSIESEHQKKIGKSLSDFKDDLNAVKAKITSMGNMSDGQLHQVFHSKRNKEPPSTREDFIRICLSLLKQGYKPKDLYTIINVSYKSIEDQLVPRTLQEEPPPKQAAAPQLPPRRQQTVKMSQPQMSPPKQAAPQLPPRNYGDNWTKVPTHPINIKD